MGYERRRYRGYVNLYRSERNVAEKSPTQIDQTLRLTEPFTLHYGDRLPDAKVAFRLAGPEDAPVIAVLGGISAHRIVAGSAGEGWWPELVGPGLGVDTRSYRVLGMDYLGGRGDSSTPEKGGKFPPLSSYDQADALCAIVRHLRLKPLHAIVGQIAAVPDALGKLVIGREPMVDGPAGDLETDGEIVVGGTQHAEFSDQIGIFRLVQTWPATCVHRSMLRNQSEHLNKSNLTASQSLI